MSLKFVFGLVENIEEKGENAGYQRFLHFPQCFQKVSLKVFNPFLHRYSFWHITNWQHLKTLREKKKFLLFPSMFSTQIIVSPSVNIFDIISFFAAYLEEPKIGIWGRRWKAGIVSEKVNLTMMWNGPLTCTKAERFSAHFRVRRLTWGRFFSHLH